MKEQVKAVLPDPVVRTIRNGKIKVKAHLPLPVLRAMGGANLTWDRNRPLFNAFTPVGPVAEMYQSIVDLPGYFAYDDSVAFTLIMRTLAAAGVTGDVLEIGCYHGRSTSIIANSVRPGERLIVIDTFMREVEDVYDLPATREIVRSAVLSRAPGLTSDQLDIRSQRSDEADLTGLRLRFAHVDGGHTHDVALGDLRMLSPVMAPGGIISVDDYAHPFWPEVTSAVDQFVAESDWAVMADVNRWAEEGRKVYLSR